MCDAGIEDSKYILRIDVDELVNSAEEHSLVSSLARQTGFWPEFGFLMQFQGLIDSILFSVSGTKLGISQSVESRVHEILESVERAVTSIYWAEVKERNQWISKHKDDEHGGTGSLPNFDYPVIIFENFMNKTGKHQFLQDLLASWSAEIVQNKLSHVIFVSPSPLASKTLNKIEMSRSLEVFFTKDAPVDSAVSFCKGTLGGHFDKEMEPFIERLGGRSSELQNFVSKVLPSFHPPPLVDKGRCYCFRSIPIYS